MPIVASGIRFVGQTVDKKSSYRHCRFVIERKGGTMLRAFVVSAVVLGSLAVAACNTVRGAAADVNSVANCTENTINTGYCK